MGYLNRHIGRAIVLLAVLITTPFAAATEYYLSPVGNDQGSGKSPEQAWSTLSYAASKLQPGDKLNISPGEYVQAGVLENVAGSATEPIIIQASIPGYAIFRGSLTLRTFKPDKNHPERYIAQTRLPVYHVKLLHPPMTMSPVSSLPLVKRSPGAWVSDRETGQLIINMSHLRMAPIGVEASVLPASGLTLRNCKHVQIQGLVVRGFAPPTGDAVTTGALTLSNCQDITIQSCSILENAAGMLIDKAERVLISHSRVLSNEQPGTSDQAQIALRQASDITIEHSEIGAAANIAVWMDNTCQGIQVNQSIVRNVSESIRDDSESFPALKRSVIVNCRQFYGRAAKSWHCTMVFSDPIPQWYKEPKRSTLLLATDMKQPHFASPAHNHFQLTATSPFRGKAPDGLDPGAYPYKGDVLFVSPDGNDDNDGLSRKHPLKTLAAINRMAQPGVTIYLAPGSYAGTLKPAANGTESQPIAIRGLPGGDVRITSQGNEPAIDLTGRKHIHLEGLTSYNSKLGVVVRRASNIVINRVMSLNCNAAGLVLLDSKRVRVNRLTSYQSRGPGVIVQGDCQSIAITDSILHSIKTTAMGVDIGYPSELFTDYNNYLPAVNRPLAIIGKKQVSDIVSLRAITGHDAMSFSAEPEIAFGKAEDAIMDTSPCVGAGHDGGHIGAGEVLSP